MGHARGHKVFVAAATRPGGLVDREAHLTLHDDPPLRAVAVLRDRRILSSLEQGRGTGRPWSSHSVTPCNDVSASGNFRMKSGNPVMGGGTASAV